MWQYRANGNARAKLELVTAICQLPMTKFTIFLQHCTEINEIFLVKIVISPLT